MSNKRRALLFVLFVGIVIGLTSKEEIVRYCALAIVPMFGMSFAYHSGVIK